MGTPAETTEEKTYSAEELKAMFDALPSEFRETIVKVNSEIDAHNTKVASIQSAEKQDPQLIKAEIFEQNPSNNKRLATLRKEELKLIEQIEAVRKQAYEVIEKDGLMPKELTEDELKRLKDETAESVKNLRESVNALAKFEEMMPMFKGKLTPHVNEIKTRRGTAKTGGSTATGEGPKRIRFKRILVNNVTQDDKGNTVYKIVDGEEKYTFTFAAMYLSKQHKGIKWTSKDLTDAYLSGIDADNLPDKHTFVMPYTFKDAQGNEQTVNFDITAER